MKRSLWIAAATLVPVTGALIFHDMLNADVRPMALSDADMAAITGHCQKECDYTQNDRCEKASYSGESLCSMNKNPDGSCKETVDSWICQTYDPDPPEYGAYNYYCVDSWEDLRCVRVIEPCGMSNGKKVCDDLLGTCKCYLWGQAAKVGRRFNCYTTLP